MNDKTLIGALTSLLLLVIVSALAAILYMKRSNEREIGDLKSGHRSELRGTNLILQEKIMRYVNSELHDNVGSLVTLMRLQLSAISYDVSQEVKDEIGELIKLTNRMGLQIKEIMTSLSEYDFQEPISFAELLEAEADKIERTGRCKVIIGEEDRNFPIDWRKAFKLFRIVQDLFKLVLQDQGISLIIIKTLRHEYQYSVVIAGNWDRGLFDTADEKVKSRLVELHGRAGIIGGTIRINDSAMNDSNILIFIEK